MESKPNLLTWLRENLSQCENGSIYLTDLEKKLKHKFNGQEIGRAVQQVFGKIPVKTVRNKYFWCKFTKKYTGITWNNRLNNEVPSHSGSESQSCRDSGAGDHSFISLTENDTKDITEILEYIMKEVHLSEKMLLLIRSQLESVVKKNGRYKWNPQLIRLCLTIYCRSPRAYQDLSKSGFLSLPSKRQIQRYKNKIDQEAGISKDVLKWMFSEARLRNLPPEGYEGGLLIDEMTIQEDVQLKKKGDIFEIIGFVECCDETVDMQKLMGNGDIQMATHALQLLFLGHTGFRFPVGHFATLQTSPAELYLIFWKAVKMLGVFGFTVTYVSLDGAQNNRLFMKMLLPENEQTSSTMKTMKTQNIFDPKKPDICIIMDYSHLMKKIRNNISKSGTTESHKRNLIYKGKYILWEHWYKAYQWDTSTNSLKVYQKLTNDHFFLNPQLKMRNNLAEDVLNSNMLHLMRKYQDSLPDQQKKDSLSSSIELLQHTSILVKNFRDQRPICEYEDSRLAENKKVLSWFCKWEADENLCEKNLISHQTREDTVSLLIGFDEMCKDKFSRSSGSIIASRVNSDPIENIFCQQRGLHNGANANPNFLTYTRSQNNVILGQATISRKSNTGGTGSEVYSDQRQPLRSILNTMKDSSVNNIKMVR